MFKFSSEGLQKQSYPTLAVFIPVFHNSLIDCQRYWQVLEKGARTIRFYLVIGISDRKRALLKADGFFLKQHSIQAVGKYEN